MTTIRKHYSPAFKAQVVQEILKGDKTVAQLAAQAGVHPNVLSKLKAAAVKALPQAFSDEALVNNKTEALLAQHEREKEQLYAEIGRLTTELNWLKKNLVQPLPRPQRLAAVERPGLGVKPEISVAAQARLLNLSRSSLYYHKVAPSEAEVELKHKIDAIFTDHPYYGSRRITQNLRRAGLVVNRKAIQRHMRQMGLEAIAPGPHLSKRNPKHRVFPYLLRGVEAAYPNHVFGIDITYIRLRRSWMYLVAVLDWHSRYVVSWELDQTLEMDFVLVAVERALNLAVPQIFNSDQGSHFTSPRYIELVSGAGAKVSMDGKGRALDNVFTERLWRTIKYESAPVKGLNNSKIVSSNLTSCG